MLRDGSADVALIQADFDEAGLDFEVLVEEPRIAVLAADHPLAERERIAVADLEPHHRPSADGRLWWPAEAPTRPRFDDLSQMVQLIELGELVAFLSDSIVARYPRRRLVARPVVDVPPARLVVAWPRAASSPATAAFVRAAVDVAARSTL